MVIGVSTAIRKVLLTPDPREKVMKTRALARNWRNGTLAHRFDADMPDAPARPERPLLLPPNKMPNRRKGGSLGGRIAMLHAFAHIEFSAIDLALDAAGRFGGHLPDDFVSDWLSVAADEALHFALLDRRLRTLGSHYGALPAHNGLWEAAEETSRDVLARLAVVPMVLEARGLDVSPAAIERFANQGDDRSAAILNRIYKDEIRHVGIGSKWFFRLCAERDLDSHVYWQKLLRAHFRGALKAPFNDSARESAGLPRLLYAGYCVDNSLP